MTSGANWRTSSKSACSGVSATRRLTGRSTPRARAEGGGGALGAEEDMNPAAET
jgi:hypothetical protein